jgi:hypothetical protein
VVAGTGASAAGADRLDLAARLVAGDDALVRLRPVAKVLAIDGPDVAAADRGRLVLTRTWPCPGSAAAPPRSSPVARPAAARRASSRPKAPPLRLVVVAHAGRSGPWSSPPALPSIPIVRRVRRHDSVVPSSRWWTIRRHGQRGRASAVVPELARHDRDIARVDPRRGLSPAGRAREGTSPTVAPGQGEVETTSIHGHPGEPPVRTIRAGARCQRSDSLSFPIAKPAPSSVSETTRRGRPVPRDVGGR